MEFENEITVEVTEDVESLIKRLENNNFSLKETYDLNDIYMINEKELEEFKNKRKEKEECDNKEYLDLLSKCILIRDIIEENKETKMLTYKYKEYNEKEEIVKQGKVKTKIDDIDSAKMLFEKLGFVELIRINDHMRVYATEKDELVIQEVNNKHVYIELEDECHYANRFYNSIDEMKDVIINYNIPIKDNNYFAKKAEVELKEILG